MEWCCTTIDTRQCHKSDHIKGFISPPPCMWWSPVLLSVALLTFPGPPWRFSVFFSFLPRPPFHPLLPMKLPKSSKRMQLHGILFWPSCHSALLLTSFLSLQAGERPTSPKAPLYLGVMFEVMSGGCIHVQHGGTHGYSSVLSSWTESPSHTHWGKTMASSFIPLFLNPPPTFDKWKAGTESTLSTVDEISHLLPLMHVERFCTGHSALALIPASDSNQPLIHLNEMDQVPSLCQCSALHFKRLST